MKTFIRIISILFLALWLCGCGGDLPTGAFSGADTASESTTAATAPSAETAGINNPSLLSEKRISVFRNHVNLHFVLSEDGIYCQEIRGNGCFAVTACPTNSWFCAAGRIVCIRIIIVMPLYITSPVLWAIGMVSSIISCRRILNWSPIRMG